MFNITKRFTDFAKLYLVKIACVAQALGSSQFLILPQLLP